MKAPICRTCLNPNADEAFCACCGEAVCLSCREEIGGLTHCPECAQVAREFINGGEDVEGAYLPTPTGALLNHRQIKF